MSHDRYSLIMPTTEGGEGGSKKLHGGMALTIPAFKTYFAVDVSISCISSVSIRTSNRHIPASKFIIIAVLCSPRGSRLEGGVGWSVRAAAWAACAKCQVTSSIPGLRGINTMWDFVVLSHPLTSQAEIAWMRAKKWES